MERINILGFSIFFIFYNFIIYSFIGWIYESTYVGIKQRKFVNRGFLSGPFIPIYGLGATIIYVLLPSKENAVIVFLSGMVFATVLEYVTSFMMEKLFHAKWWDYSDMKFNFQGRISLLASMFWGFLSILMTEVLQPIVNLAINAIPYRTGNRFAILLVGVLLVDFTLTVVSSVKLDQKLAKLYDLRMGLERYLEKIRLPEMRNLLKEKGLPDFEIAWKDYLAKGKLTERVEYIKEKEEKIAGYFKKYYTQMNAVQAIQKRLLKAFPNMKSENRQQELSALRKRFLSRRKK